MRNTRAWVMAGHLAALLLAACGSPPSPPAPEAEAILAAQLPACLERKWPLEREGRLVIAARQGQTRWTDGVWSGRSDLLPGEDLVLVAPPGREPGPEPWRGLVQTFPAPPAPGLYQISLDQRAWIDVFQNGQPVASVDFTGGMEDCVVHKSVRFDLTDAPFTIQLSGVTADSVAIIITPASD